MNALLTPEQMKDIESRHLEADNLPWIGMAVHQLGNAAHIHRGKLLRDREAIAERLSGIELRIRAARNDDEVDMGANELRSLVIAIRGEK